MGGGKFQALSEWEVQLIFHNPDAFLTHQCILHLKTGVGPKGENTALQWSSLEKWK